MSHLKGHGPQAVMEEKIMFPQRGNIYVQRTISVLTCMFVIEKKKLYKDNHQRVGRMAAEEGL